jgi:hypothetical protein
MAKLLLEPPGVAFPVGLALLRRLASALDRSSASRGYAMPFLPRLPLAEPVDVPAGPVRSHGTRELECHRIETGVAPGRLGPDWPKSRTGSACVVGSSGRRSRPRRSGSRFASSLAYFLLPAATCVRLSSKRGCPFLSRTGSPNPSVTTERLTSSNASCL